MFLSKFSRRLAYAIGIIFFVLFAFIGAFFLAMHTPWGKEKLASFAAKALVQSGWRVEIGQIEGTLPKEVFLRKISLISPRGDEILIESLDAKLSLLRLLKREIAFKTVHAQGIHWNLPKTAETISTATAVRSAPSQALPFSFVLSQFELTNVYLPHQEEKPFNFSGSLIIGRRYRMGNLRLSASLREQPEAVARLSLFIKSNRQMQCTLDTEQLPFDVLAPWISLPLEGSWSIHAIAQGFLDGLEPFKSSLKGQLNSSVQIDKTLALPAFEPLLLGAWSARSAFERSSDGVWKFSNLKAAGDHLTVQGSGDIESLQSIGPLSFRAELDSLQSVKLLPIEGKWNIDLHSQDGKTYSIAAAAPLASWHKISAENAVVRAQGTFGASEWIGSCSGAATFGSQRLQGKSDFSYVPSHSLNLEQLEIFSEAAQAEGQLQIFSSHLVQGTLKAAIKNLHEWLPSSSFYGSLEGVAQLAILENAPEQSVLLECSGKNLFFDALSIEESSLRAALSGSWESPRGTILLEGSKAHFKDVFLETVSFDGTLNEVSSPFACVAKGEWKEPFALSLNGTWETESGSLNFSLDSATGSVLNRPVSLESPASLQISPPDFRLENLRVLVGGARLEASAIRVDGETDASLSLKHFPLDFLSINPLSIDVAGSVDLTADLSSKNNSLQGSLKAQIADLEIIDAVKSEAVHGVGTLSAFLKNSRIALDADLAIEDAPLLQIAADLPIAIDSQSGKIHLALRESAEAKLNYDGKIEDILDFFDLGTQRLEGKCLCDLSLSGSLETPALKGACTLANGRYENYYCGMQLEDLSWNLEGRGSSLILTSLDARDIRHKGTVSLIGEILMKIGERLPFAFDGSFYRLTIADTSAIQAEAEGLLHISGNLDSMKISGDAQILESDIGIPDRIPQSLPTLQVTYINVSKPMQSAPPVRGRRYPVFFDISVRAPDSVFLSGRGLVSEWKGAFHLGGSAHALQAKGSLEMLSGAFHFSGRTFELTEGTISLSGQPSEIPQIRLSARMTLQNLSITARLAGPLNAPEISFQSSPPLPMGSILSYLLFGQELSDINAFQAAQLITSLAALSGEQADLLEHTRKSLGVDRLRIIAAPARGEDAEQKLAVQIGKYVTRGVLVSVSQGTEENSTNLSIEVDLTNGFIFQAESIQEQEQGKFTLKWNLNY